MANTKQPRLDIAADVPDVAEPSEAMQAVLSDIAAKFASSPDGQALQQAVQQQDNDPQPKR